MSGHTPGPWRVVNGKDVFTELGGARADGKRADDNDGWQIADCGVAVCFVDGGECELPRAEEEANARLIAAAPDLLDALIRCVAEVRLEAGHIAYAAKGFGGDEDVPPDESVRLSAIADLADAAIAKATGVQP